MKKAIEKAEEVLKDADGKCSEDMFGYIDGTDFSIFIHRLLIPTGRYVIDIGNYENVNYAVAHSLLKKVKKHPLLWKIFFMVA